MCSGRARSELRRSERRRGREGRRVDSGVQGWAPKTASSSVARRRCVAWSSRGAALTPAAASAQLLFRDGFMQQPPTNAGVTTLLPLVQVVISRRGSRGTRRACAARRPRRYGDGRASRRRAGSGLRGCKPDRLDAGLPAPPAGRRRTADLGLDPRHLARVERPGHAPSHATRPVTAMNATTITIIAR